MAHDNLYLNQTIAKTFLFLLHLENKIHHLTILLQRHIRPQKQMNINLSLFLIKYHFIVLYILRRFSCASKTNCVYKHSQWIKINEAIWTSIPCTYLRLSIFRTARTKSISFSCYSSSIWHHIYNKSEHIFCQYSRYITLKLSRSLLK